ncbi:DUF192 domain-containing protein [Candidatus Woesearchaeota archaeon]|nr:DUF192 domain-containing protein [Candidatus Woesearchaeota archaeon]
MNRISAKHNPKSHLSMFCGGKNIGKARICKTMRSKTLGLMLSQKKETLILVLPKMQKASIHTFFMLYPIDVIYTDEKGIISEIKNNMRPWALFFPKLPARYIIEAPSGFAKKNRLRKGITLQLR